MLAGVWSGAGRGAALAAPLFYYSNGVERTRHIKRSHHQFGSLVLESEFLCRGGVEVV